MSADEALAIVRDGDTVAVSGFVGSGTPDELIAALERRFRETASPKALTLVFAAAPGDGKDRGLNQLAHDGLVKRAIGGHWSLVPKLAAMAVSNRIEAYNLPLGIISHLFRDIAAHRAGTLSKVGLRTFVDPRCDGGKINACTSEDLVRLMEIDDEEWLFYKAFPITVALIRGSTSGSRRQHHDGARGADARQPGARDGGEEFQWFRDRAGRAHRGAQRHFIHAKSSCPACWSIAS